MMSIEVGGGRSATLRFMNRLELSEISNNHGTPGAEQISTLLWLAELPPTRGAVG